MSATSRKHNQAKGTLYRGALIQVSPDGTGYSWMYSLGRFDTYGMGQHSSAAEAFLAAVDAIDEEICWEEVAR